MDELVAEPPQGERSRSPQRRLACRGRRRWRCSAGSCWRVVGGLIVDIPALLLGVKITGSHMPARPDDRRHRRAGRRFVLAAVFFAQLGGRTVRSWQFGLRRPGVGWRAAVGLIAAAAVHLPPLQRDLGLGLPCRQGEGARTARHQRKHTLLLLSAALTCVVAPICEEFLFRGFIFTALRNWRGTWPAAVITGLVFGGGARRLGARARPRAARRRSASGCACSTATRGSLYPCIVAHSLNNSLAFASLENWGWQIRC